jgi:hypothetical protein
MNDRGLEMSNRARLDRVAIDPAILADPRCATGVFSCRSSEVDRRKLGIDLDR